MRLIDADEANVDSIPCYYGSQCYIEDVEEWLKDQPTIDAVPVVHGRWLLCAEEDEYSISEHFKCNICNAMHYSDDNYCPCCGTKMDLETNNEGIY